MSVLSLPTLILNKSWHAIDATIVSEAFGKVMNDRARFICPKTYILHDIDSWMNLEVDKNDKSIQTLHGNIRVPEVIVTTKYNKVPNKKVVFSRKNLWRRDHYRCQYCGKMPAYNEVTVDHILPRSRGGLSSFENCVLSCVECNVKKNNRTPEESGMRLRKMATGNNGLVAKYYHRPKNPSWNPIYAAYRKSLPKSWSQFLNNKIDELYWDVELEP